MLKKTITYTDYDGNERTEDFYFNLTKAEILEMEMSTEGGLEKMIRRIIDTKDSARLIEIFKRIVINSYGVKSPDGRRFIKSEEVKDAFRESEAYSNLFMELATDDKAAADFINGVIPKDIVVEASQPVLASAI